MTQGLILLAHGARDPRWAQPFEDIARRIRAARPEVAVELAFLEFLAPDLPTAGARLAAAGCASVEVLPVFLGVGGHVRKDLPRLVEQVADRHPAVRWRVAPTIGEIDAVVAAMAGAALALLQPTP
ncbi:MAG: CbiX/SirB N-terminal domain-containing protein [Burkholderiaceae bacterium]|nr:CbiX/SirB N-terminal domain-containing protein [Burkholderiaceae bacterium]